MDNGGMRRRQPSAGGMEQEPSAKSERPVATAPAARSKTRESSLRSETLSGSARKYSLLNVEDEPERRCKYHFLRFCNVCATSRFLSGFTTLLTVGALWGDDFRLMLMYKDDDWMFNIGVIIAMVVYTFEIVVCFFGTPGYRYGFYFWLDLISTYTMVLDITTVSEAAFGDMLSQADDINDASQSQGSDPAEAVRAAKTSKVVVKAGRIVRLIRIVRLMKVMKRAEQHKTSKMGHDWDTPEDEMINVGKESAVSKKLSDITTRKTVMLVLVILLSLPFFQVNMWFVRLPDSGQSGVDLLFRLWCDGLNKYQPSKSEANRLRYMASPERRVYEDDFRSFVYYHNPLCSDQEVEDAYPRDTPMSSFAHIFFLSVLPSDSINAKFSLPAPQANEYDWDEKWSGANWSFYRCKLPKAAQKMVDWKESYVCKDGRVRGVSILKDTGPRVTCPSEYRYQERVLISPLSIPSQGECANTILLFGFEKGRGTKVEALLNSLQVLFISFLLIFGALAFSNDASKLVLTPLERIISKLQRIWLHPLEAIRLARGSQIEVEMKAGDMSRLGRLKQWLYRCFCFWRKADKKPDQVPMETVVLEKTIIQIGSLLALGFGDAGADIFNRNMGTGSKFTPMAPAVVIDGLFACCTMRKFAHTTEQFGDQVMPYVNRVADIVHSWAYRFLGSPIRTLSDSFFLVWRLDQAEDWMQRRMADLAGIALMKIAAMVGKCSTLDLYQLTTAKRKKTDAEEDDEHPKTELHRRSYTGAGAAQGSFSGQAAAVGRSSPAAIAQAAGSHGGHHRCRMSFGLHRGRAIGAAFGSDFKVVPSYLGPEVDLVASIEALTAEYHTHIIVSEEAQGLMSHEVSEELRLLDRVRFPGRDTPLRLYSLDIDDRVVEVEFSDKFNKRKNMQQAVERRRQRAQLFHMDYNVLPLLQDDTDIASMRLCYTPMFFAQFAMGYHNYEAGEWKHARELLESTRFILSREDGPSGALLDYMRQYNYVAPETWPGYRAVVPPEMRHEGSG